MQENLTIARPYAQAAFEQARDEGGAPAWSEALAYLAAVVTDAGMRRVIHDPRISAQRLLDLLFEVGGKQFFPSFRNFIKVLSSAHRLGIVPEIALIFENRRAAAENIANVEVVSAYPLDAQEQERIATAVKKRLKKEVRITQRVDQNLIGGAVVRVGDTVYDVSLKGGLNQLANLFNWK